MLYKVTLQSMGEVLSPRGLRQDSDLLRRVLWQKGGMNFNPSLLSDRQGGMKCNSSSLARTNRAFTDS